MLVNVNAASAGKQNALGELGELSRARVNLSEFRYNRSAEIYGETEPADYIYQVVDGAVRTYKLLSDGDVKSALSIWLGTSSVWKTATFIVLLRRQLSIRLSAL